MLCPFTKNKMTLPFGTAEFTYLKLNTKERPGTSLLGFKRLLKVQIDFVLFLRKAPLIPPLLQFVLRLDWRNRYAGLSKSGCE